MDREQRVRQQSEWLEPLIWQCTPEQLRALEAILAAQLAALGVTMKEVFAHLSDEDLILAIQKGFLVKEAFEELLENRYKKILFRWCYYWGLSFEDAEDLAHTLFLKFWMSRFDSYEAPGEKCDNFRSFLWTTAYHRWLQERRKKKPGFLEGCPEPSTNGHSAEQLVRELQEQLEAAVCRLPELDQRIMRAKLGGRTLREIAAELGLTYRAVAMRLFRARNFLEQSLELPQRNRAERGSS
jgi:RNA polymerase sigma factor (sigma-70 family)